MQWVILAWRGNVSAARAFINKAGAIETFCMTKEDLMTATPYFISWKPSTQKKKSESVFTMS